MLEDTEKRGRQTLLRSTIAGFFCILVMGPLNLAFFFWGPHRWYSLVAGVGIMIVGLGALVSSYRLYLALKMLRSVRASARR